MIGQFENIEKEILEYCYFTILSSRDYYHNFSVEELKEDIRFKNINKNELSNNVPKMKTKEIKVLQDRKLRKNYKIRSIKNPRRGGCKGQIIAKETTSSHEHN
ncbi:MAG: hypothetical protein KGD61_10950 [Candidatus Lokiarchaeota archaeon]|nr:hypothetical protein [Candidatus Lokiarchaeota archaeon]